MKSMLDISLSLSTYQSSGPSQEQVVGKEVILSRYKPDGSSPQYLLGLILVQFPAHFDPTFHSFARYDLKQNHRALLNCAKQVTQVVLKIGLSFQVFICLLSKNFLPPQPLPHLTGSFLSLPGSPLIFRFLLLMLSHLALAQLMSGYQFRQLRGSSLVRPNPPQMVA